MLPELNIFYLYFEQFYSLGNEKNMDKALRAEANSIIRSANT